MPHAAEEVRAGRQLALCAEEPVDRREREAEQEVARRPGAQQAPEGPRREERHERRRHEVRDGGPVRVRERSHGPLQGRERVDRQAGTAERRKVLVRVDDVANRYVVELRHTRRAVDVERVVAARAVDEEGHDGEGETDRGDEQVGRPGDHRKHARLYRRAQAAQSDSGCDRHGRAEPDERPESVLRHASEHHRRHPTRRCGRQQNAPAAAVRRFLALGIRGGSSVLRRPTALEHQEQRGEERDGGEPNRDEQGRARARQHAPVGDQRPRREREDAEVAHEVERYGKAARGTCVFFARHAAGYTRRGLRAFFSEHPCRCARAPGPGACANARGPCAGSASGTHARRTEFLAP